MAQQSAKRDSTMHLLKHVGTLQTFIKTEKNNNNNKFMKVQYRCSVKQQHRAGVFKLGFGDPIEAAVF